MRVRVHEGRVVPDEVITAAGHPGDQGRREKGRQQGNERGVGLHAGAQQSAESGDGEYGSDAHRAYAHRIDIVEMAAFELDRARREAEWHVDDKIGHHRRHP